MHASTTSFLFPDVNVWVALTHTRHIHHQIAHDWLTAVGSDFRLCFCRFTQLGLLRLLTTEAAMVEDVLSQTDAWRVYDRWRRDERVVMVDEHPEIDRRFRALSGSRRATPKVWADAYLAAFAETSRLTLVTFDRAFRGRTSSLLLLEE